MHLILLFGLLLSFINNYNLVSSAFFIIFIQFVINILSILLIC